MPDLGGIGYSDHPLCPFDHRVVGASLDVVMGGQPAGRTESVDPHKGGADIHEPECRLGQGTYKFQGVGTQHPAGDEDATLPLLGCLQADAQ